MTLRTRTRRGNLGANLLVASMTSTGPRNRTPTVVRNRGHRLNATAEIIVCVCRQPPRTRKKH
eukprot:5888064-Lingulodinium_polyedra.AAC.1